VVLAAGGGGIHEQRLGLVGVEQHLALHGDETDFAVQEPLLFGVPHADLVFGPQCGELRTAIEESVGEADRPRSAAFPRGDGA